MIGDVPSYDDICPSTYVNDFLEEEQQPPNLEYILTTNDGDVRTFRSEEDARRNQYIFGGGIKVRPVRPKE